jgi:hypothetical protein
MDKILKELNDCLSDIPEWELDIALGILESTEGILTRSAFEALSELLHVSPAEGEVLIPAVVTTASCDGFIKNQKLIKSNNKTSSECNISIGKHSTSSSNDADGHLSSNLHFGRVSQGQVVVFLDELTLKSDFALSISSDDVKSPSNSGQSCCTQIESIKVCLPDYSVESCTVAFKFRSFGAYEFLVRVKHTCYPPTTKKLSSLSPIVVFEDVKLVVISESPVFHFVRSLDELYDKLFWSWQFKSLEESWSTALENSILELLLSVEDDLKPFLGKLHALQSGMGGLVGSGGSITTLGNTLQEDFHAALEKHDTLALGRLHTTLYQFVEMNHTLPMIPANIIQAIFTFEKEKSLLGDIKGLQNAISELHKSSERYLKFLSGRQESDVVSVAKRVQNAWDVSEIILLKLAEYFNTGVSSDVSFDKLSSLRSAFSFSQLLTAGILANPSASEVRDWKVSAFQMLPLAILNEDLALDKYLDCLCESLACMVIMVGGMPPFQFRLDKHSLSDSAMLISRLIEGGLGYVSQEGSMISLFGTTRAFVRLKPEKGRENIHDRKLSSRIKDSARVLRNVLSRTNGKLSLRLNTNFDLAVDLLRKHHGKQSWVDDNLALVWKEMVATQRMHIFELCAADFGHFGVGRRYFYIATRYYSESHRKLQPGFILAFAEAKFLQQNGVVLWDFGDFDLNPQMAYKSSISQLTSRVYFWKQLKELRIVYRNEGKALSPDIGIEASETKSSTPAVLKYGVVIESISPEDLLTVDR